MELRGGLDWELAGSYLDEADEVTSHWWTRVGSRNRQLTVQLSEIYKPIAEQTQSL